MFNVYGSRQSFTNQKPVNPKRSNTPGSRINLHLYLLANRVKDDQGQGYAKGDQEGDKLEYLHIILGERCNRYNNNRYDGQDEHPYLKPFEVSLLLF